MTDEIIRIHLRNAGLPDDQLMSRALRGYEQALRDYTDRVHAFDPLGELEKEQEMRTIELLGVIAEGFETVSADLLTPEILLEAQRYEPRRSDDDIIKLYGDGVARQMDELRADGNRIWLLAETILETEQQNRFLAALDLKEVRKTIDSLAALFPGQIEPADDGEDLSGSRQKYAKARVVAETLRGVSPALEARLIRAINLGEALLADNEPQPPSQGPRCEPG